MRVCLQETEEVTREPAKPSPDRQVGGFSGMSPIFKAQAVPTPCHLPGTKESL